MHMTDAPDYQDMGAGERRFKETPLPASVVGHHIMNALQYEIAQTITGAGLSLRLSGADDETAGWGQLKEAIQTMINYNEQFYDFSSGITVKDGADNTLTVNQAIGRVAYHVVEKIIRLALILDVKVPSDTNLIKFEIPGDFRAFGADLSTHPCVQVGCFKESGGGFVIHDNIFVNMTSTSPPLVNMVYLSNYEIAWTSSVSVSDVFPGLGADGIYRFGINYSLKRVI